MTRLLFQPQTRDALRAGIDTLAGAVMPTLGPLTGPVALADKNRDGSPELLDDGGAIARRILQLPDKAADVGAMLLREILWRQKERYGDGAATTAALYQTVFAQGHRFINAGGDAMLLRRHLEHGMRLLLDELRAMAKPVESAADIERLAMSICGDADIAAALADIFDVLGAHSPVEVRDGGRDLQHEFFLGSYWECKVPSNIVFAGRAGDRIELSNSAWLISDFELDDLNALVRLVTQAVEAGFDSLAIVAKSFSEQVIAAQGANSRMENFRLVYLELTGLLDEQAAALDDLALLTGGQALHSMAGHCLDNVEPAALGETELAWLDRNRFGIIAGSGDEATVEREIATLARRYRNSDDDRRREVLSARMGRLRGGSALVYCNGSSESELRYRREIIEGTIAALRSALLEGALPGGGTALLRCLAGLQAAHDSSPDAHERVALKILMRTAQAPCQQLLSNAGHEAPSLVVDEILRSENGTGYDLSAGLVADMWSQGVLDSAAVVLAAVRNGIGGAALALTVDTIVHRVNPPLAIEPGGLPADAQMGNIELK